MTAGISALLWHSYSVLSCAVIICRAKFDKFVPTMEDRIDPHSPVPFGEMFGQGVDDMIGGVRTPSFILLPFTLASQCGT